MESIPLQADPIYVFITVDGDLRLGGLDLQKAGVRAMREIHQDMGLPGKTTWFINEYDFHWTENHGDLLLDLLQSGETIAIHDHFDTHYAETYPEVYQIGLESKTRLEGFLKQQELDGLIAIHRNGCALQSAASYAALKDLGYRILSDVWPENTWQAREIAIQHPVMPWRYLTDGDEDTIEMDNRHIPLTASPWRHDAENWLDYQSQTGPFLQVPITTMPWVDRERVNKAVAKPGGAGWIVLDTHPYDLQDPQSGQVDPGRMARYREDLQWLNEKLQPEFIRLDEVPGLLGLGSEN